MLIPRLLFYFTVHTSRSTSVSSSQIPRPRTPLHTRRVHSRARRPNLITRACGAAPAACTRRQTQMCPHAHQRCAMLPARVHNTVSQTKAMKHHPAADDGKGALQREGPRRARRRRALRHRAKDAPATNRVRQARQRDPHRTAHHRPSHRTSTTNHARNPHDQRPTRAQHGITMHAS